MKVFISSSTKSPKILKETIYRTINLLGFTPVILEDYLIEGMNILSAAKIAMSQCDIIVIIITHDDKLINKELKWLYEKNIQLFIYLETNIDKKKLELPKRYKISYFRDSLDLRNKVMNEIISYKTELKKIERLASTDKSIPIAPVPFIAHPYPLPEHFTGRAAEKAMLSNWLFNEKEPMLVLEAIGGMGKTALTWVWLQEVMEKAYELDGIFWWSFYEEPFEIFIEHLFYYINHKVALFSCMSYKLDIVIPT